MTISASTQIQNRFTPESGRACSTAPSYGDLQAGGRNEAILLSTQIFHQPDREVGRKRMTNMYIHIVGYDDLGLPLSLSLLLTHTHIHTHTNDSFFPICSAESLSFKLLKCFHALICMRRLTNENGVNSTHHYLFFLVYVCLADGDMTPYSPAAFAVFAHQLDDITAFDEYAVRSVLKAVRQGPISASRLARARGRKQIPSVLSH